MTNLEKYLLSLPTEKVLEELRRNIICPVCPAMEFCVAHDEITCCDEVLKTWADMGNPITEDEPMTLDELREMDGEPVYLVDMEPIEYGWTDGWYLVDADEDIAFNVVKKFELKDCAGFAYRHPPEWSEP